MRLIMFRLLVFRPMNKFVVIRVTFSKTWKRGARNRSREPPIKWFIYKSDRPRTAHVTQKTEFDDYCAARARPDQKTQTCLQKTDGTGRYVKPLNDRVFPARYQASVHGSGTELYRLAVTPRDDADAFEILVPRRVLRRLACTNDSIANHNYLTTW